MKILHFHPADDKVIVEYVQLLSSVCTPIADIHACTTIGQLKKEVSEWQPDIVHLHGCWSFAHASASQLSRRQGARIVVSTHGQLEPWVIGERYWKEKLPKTLLYQRATIRSAYAAIAMGRMESECLHRLKWNPRIEIVRNAQITKSITPEEMGREICAIYRKVLDSDVLKRMQPATITTMSALIKAGITRDARWLTTEERSFANGLSDDEWRKLRIYAHEENITETIDNGIAALQLNAPVIDVSSIRYYLPEKYNAPAVLTDTLFVPLIRSMYKLSGRKQLTVCHLVNLATFLRTQTFAEDEAVAELKKYKLSAFTGRLMHLLSEITGLEEGFMPVHTINDKGTKQLRKTINKHLEI